MRIIDFSFFNVMDFIHRPYLPGDTIVALATPPGEGGIAIIRISGNEALAIAARVCSGAVQDYISHTAHFGYIKDLKGKKIDEALVLVMRSPHSYTGEDTVELQCHGGHFSSQKVLEAVIQAGARPASAGEFTFKAFMNGKMDLAQAEAVQKVIMAKNSYAFEAAGRHLEGALSKKIEAFQKSLIRIAALFEAWVDFPEEGIEFAPFEEVVHEIEGLLLSMSELIDTFYEGKKVEQGISLCIAGPPNAGKSSLMNALLGEERAIVTPIAGTTRDLLKEDLFLNGLHMRLIDTAGIRETEECIEKEGIRRSKEALQKADLALLVLDGASNTELSPLELEDHFPLDKTIVVWNKKDLPGYRRKLLDFPHVVEISTLEKEGLDQLKRAIDQLIWRKGAPPQEEIILTSLRHKEALSQAIQRLSSVLTGLHEGVSPEFLSADVKSALIELGRIRGSNLSEEILSSIFSQFCVGK